MDVEQKQWLAWGVLGVVLVAALASSHGICRGTYLKYGLEMPVCTDGTVRQTAAVTVRGVRRGAPGVLDFVATAHYTTDESDSVRETTVPAMQTVAVSLVDAKKKATPLAIDWHQDRGLASAPLALAQDLPDGDYTLHADYTTKLGSGTVDVPLPLYTPARIHVITDRPLYEPGNAIKFRAVVLRARDLAPLDGRPGQWVVRDPAGDILLEEKTSATDWGVVAGSFPLDRGALPGTYTIAFQSAAATDQVSVEVKPFTLPRFRVEATADKPFYGAGDAPTIKGNVIYASGAPVANAQVDVQWSASGDWPPPTEWLESVLPKHATTAPNGRFELAIPKIPADLVGQASLVARVAAVDPAGDRVEGSARVLLSQDAIAVTAVTELENGLVGGQNNRLYLRVATPDGRVITNAKVHVKPTWEPQAVALEGTLDEDGVAALQIDPGAPVNIVVPPAPYRPSKREPIVTRTAVEELVKGEGASLADQVAMDRWLPALAPCAKWFDGAGAVRVGARVDRAGGILAVSGAPDPMGQCIAAVVRAQRLPAGEERLYTISFALTDPPLAKLMPSIESTLDAPNGLEERVAVLARGARDCLPTAEGTRGSLPAMLSWRATARSKIVELGAWIPDATIEDRAATPALACAQARIAGRVELAEPAETDTIGLVRFALDPPTVEGDTRPVATTMLGYELAVSITADLDGKPASTKLRMTPGVQPNLRLRVTPVLAKRGDTVTAELLRGPNYTAKLPDELELESLHAKAKAPVDKDKHTATFVIDDKSDGWIEIRGGGQRALVYVRPAGELAVAIHPAQPAYKPGDLAHLLIETTSGGKGGKAALGLIGVDESLGQLVALPGPDDMGRVRPQVTTSAPAFGMIDGQALALGRVRGANAAAATVLRVSSIPPPPELDAVVDARAQSHFDAIEELTDRFYGVLAELHVQARAWETSAPKGELMRPATMAQLWTKALVAVAARGERVDDAYGRRLRLSRLPRDLLELTDPRMVIVQGTRLPEDVENWVQWVQKEKP